MDLGLGESGTILLPLDMTAGLCMIIFAGSDTSASFRTDEIVGFTSPLERYLCFLNAILLTQGFRQASSTLCFSLLIAFDWDLGLEGSGTIILGFSAMIPGLWVIIFARSDTCSSFGVENILGFTLQLSRGLCSANVVPLFLPQGFGAAKDLKGEDKPPKMYIAVLLSHILVLNACTF